MKRAVQSAEKWREAAELLVLSIEVPFRLILSPEVTIEATALVRGVGARNGLLLVESEARLLPHRERIAELGYAWAKAPLLVDEEGVVEVMRLLSDMDWTGPARDRPGWMDPRT
jgi:hypothetical protein